METNGRFQGKCTWKYGRLVLADVWLLEEPFLPASLLPSRGWVLSLRIAARILRRSSKSLHASSCKTQTPEDEFQNLRCLSWASQVRGCSRCQRQQSFEEEWNSSDMPNDCFPQATGEKIPGRATILRHNLPFHCSVFLPKSMCDATTAFRTAPLLSAQLFSVHFPWQIVHKNANNKHTSFHMKMAIFSFFYSPQSSVGHRFHAF